MLPILYYDALDYKSVEKSFGKTLQQLARGDFRSADVKKLGDNGYYRARLDLRDRLLFTITSWQGKRYLLLLEVIKNHQYAKSRFLRGAPVPAEDRMISVHSADDVAEETVGRLAYVNESRPQVHILNKFISFDETQESIFRLQAPLIIIGSAGSGKTVLVLEKLKQLQGNLAYVSLSRYLVENARKMYYSHGYDNEGQEVDFLSFSDYLASWKIPSGGEVKFPAFEAWFTRHAQHMKLREPYRVFEEFKGVITGSPLHAPWLSREEYLSLGVRQSIFPAAQRERVYELFGKYTVWLKENGYYDGNILSHEYLERIRPRYDYLIVDEVQDITNIQLKAIMQSLVHKNNFILTGDSNQIVHPNFFSWSKIKTYLYRDQDQTQRRELRILQTNYRNSTEVVRASNNLLKIKNARFGSIDKESNYLITTVSKEPGEVILLAGSDKIKADLNKKTQHSTRYAVIVPDDAAKQEARRVFKTPLIFSVHQAKGLEYENVILLNFISSNPAEFNEIISGVEEEDLGKTRLAYARPADKGDKDAEVYKFYVNSLYVAMTRSVRNIYLFESQPGHRLLQLLGLKENAQPLKVSEEKSDVNEWLREADRLEAQGKYEQAEQIRAKMHGYEYLSPEQLEKIRALALDPSKKEAEVKRERKQLFQYATGRLKIDWIEQLAALGFQRAVLFIKEVKQERKDYVKSCRLGRRAEVEKTVRKYGVDFAASSEGATGLMLALYHGQDELAAYFLDQKASVLAKDAGGSLPVHYLLQGFFRNELHKETSLAGKDTLLRFWHVVRPVAVTLKTQAQKINVSGHSMLFFLIVCMQSTEGMVPSKVKFAFPDPERPEKTTASFSMDMVMRFVGRVPGEILPPYRQQRPYVNSVLAMHEVDKDSPYNKQAFQRVGRGCYAVNPLLQQLC